MLARISYSVIMDWSPPTKLADLPSTLVRYSISLASLLMCDRSVTIDRFGVVF